MPVSSFDEPQFSITAGQAAVWYDGDIVGWRHIESKTKRQKQGFFTFFLGVLETDTCNQGVFVFEQAN